MSSKKTKTAIAEMLQQVKNVQQSSEEGSQISILKKDSPQDLTKESTWFSTAELHLNKILKIEPTDCTLWEFKDRTTCDLGDIKQLAEDIKANGQSQPGIVRPIKNKDKKYEIIVGERRWRACSQIGVPFEAVIKEITDQEAALIQASENLQRKDLSDFAKGMNYSKLINRGVITQTELQKKLNLSKATMSALLSFADIPPQVIEAIGDMSKVTAYVSSLIRSYANKGNEYISALISIAPSIQGGIGSDNLKKLINSKFSDSVVKQDEIIPVYNENKQKLFSMKTKNSRLIEVNFHVPVSNFRRIENLLIKEIEAELELV